MNSRFLETFKALNNCRYGRSNMLAALLGGSAQNRKRELGALREQGYLRCPEQQKDAGNYRYSPRIYELTQKAREVLRNAGIAPINWKGERQFWHQLMVADILLSFQVGCKERGLRFQSQSQIIGDKGLALPCRISHTFSSGRTLTWDKALRPDELFAINDTHFLLEADRQNEPIERSEFQTSSYLRKLLQYRDVFANRTYKTELGIQKLLVLNITLSEDRVRNIMNFMELELKGKSRALLFAAFPALGSRETYPRPMSELLDHPFERVGHEPFIIRKEVV
jgi:hypothetical protein